MKNNGILNDEDHENMDAFLGFVLDDYKNGKITKEQAVSGIAHVITAIDERNEDEAKMWLAQGRRLVRA